MNKVAPLLWMCILRPYPSFVTGATALAIGGRGVDAFILLTAMLALFARGCAAHPTSIFKPLWFTSIALWVYAVGLLVYASLMGFTISVRDLFEPQRLLLLTLLLLFSFNHPPTQIAHKWKTLWVGSVLIYLFVVLSQIFNIDLLMMLCDLIWDPVTSKSKYVKELNIARLTGFFINPNWAGVFLAWALAYFIFVDTMTRFSRFVMVSVTFFLIIMSGSRTGLICSLFVFGVFIVISNWRRALTIGGLAVGLLYVSLTSFDIVSLLPRHHLELLNVLLQGRDFSEVSTFGDRLRLWDVAIHTYFMPSNGLGVGPLKAGVASVLDNQYVKWLVWYGVPGLIFHFVFYIILATHLYNSSRRTNCDAAKLATALLVMLLTLLLASITGAFFDVTQLSFAYIMLCGWVLGATSRTENALKSHGLS